jgi:hypothetical protein
MKTPELLTEDGIERYAQYLGRETNRLEFYRTLMALPEGRFLLQELKERLALVLSLYAAVPCNDPQKAAIVLAGLQADEWEVREWIRRLEQTPQMIAAMAEQRGKLQNILRQRKATDRSDVRFVPSGAEKKGRKRETGNG